MLNKIFSFEVIMICTMKGNSGMVSQIWGSLKIQLLFIVSYIFSEVSIDFMLFLENGSDRCSLVENIPGVIGTVGSLGNQDDVIALFTQCGFTTGGD